MSNPGSLKIETFINREPFVGFEIGSGADDIFYLIQGQILSDNPSLILGKSLSLLQVARLRSIDDRISSNKEEPPIGAGEYVEIFSLLLKELSDSFVNINRIRRLLQREQDITTLIYTTLAKNEITQDNEQLLRKLDHYQSRIERAGPAIQRIIDICRYAAALDHKVRIYRIESS